MHAVSELVRHPGNEALFDAVELSLMSARLGWPLHLHAEGVRGTGKTTVLRSVCGRLPRIRRVKGCLYNCDPSAPHCPRHRDMDPQELAREGSEWIEMPFLEISHSARLGTVVGTIDLQRVMSADRPEAVLLPGTLAKAHRGIVFVDEVNRLADTAPELVDALLDVMGTKPGRLQIEESGLPPVALSVQVTVWAASNPDEEPGPLEDIRRQLADRFDLAVHVRRPEAVEQVRLVLDRTSALHPGRVAAAGWEQVQGARSRQQGQGMERRSPYRLPATRFPAMPEDLRTLIAELYLRFDLESLRAVEAWQWAARLHAWRRGQDDVRREDVLAVAPLVLHHRLEPEVLGDLLRALREERPAAAEMAASAALADDGKAPHAHGRRPAGKDGRPGGADDGLADDPHRQGAARQPRGEPRAGFDGLFARLRSLLHGDDGAGGGPAGPAGIGGRRPAGGHGEDGQGEVPAPPHPARPLHHLTESDLIRRMGLGEGLTGLGDGGDHVPYR